MTTVLVIEDEQALTRLIVWGLVEAGFVVGAVASTAEATARSGQFAPDVIVFNTVINQPEKHLAMRELRAAFDGVRILDVSQEKNLRAGGIIVGHDVPSLDGVADAHMGLPFPIDRLIEEIHRLAPAASKRGV